MGVLSLYALAIATDGASIVSTGGFLQPNSALGASARSSGCSGPI